MDLLNNNYKANINLDLFGLSAKVIDSDISGRNECKEEKLAKKEAELIAIHQLLEKEAKEEMRTALGLSEKSRNRLRKYCPNNVLPSSFVGVDFETLYSQRVSACSVGMVKYKNGEIVDRFYTKIRPPFDYEGKCGVALTWIHGFTEDDFEGDRTMEELLPEIETFAEGLPLVAHNASVESACFRDTTGYYGVETSIDFENIIDTLQLSYAMEDILGIDERGPGTHTLDAVCRRFNEPELNHHNALDDAEMCGNLLLKFGKIIENAPSLKDELDNYHPQQVTNAKYNPEDKIERRDMENVTDNPFKGCGVVLTGFSTCDSQKYGHQLKELGALVRAAISSKTKWLICGANAGPVKVAKAKEMGINIISEEEFIATLENLD